MKRVYYIYVLRPILCDWSVPPGARRAMNPYSTYDSCSHLLNAAFLLRPCTEYGLEFLMIISCWPAEEEEPSFECIWLCAVIKSCFCDVWFEWTRRFDRLWETQIAVMDSAEPRRRSCSPLTLTTCPLCLHSILPMKQGLMMGQYLGAFNLMDTFKGRAKKQEWAKRRKRRSQGWLKQKETYLNLIVLEL